jgi:hypothetical protein
MLNGYGPNSNIRTVAYTIGAPGVAGCDYNFASAANMTEQSIQLGATNIIPKDSPVSALVAKCVTTVSGGISCIVDIGKTSGTDEYISSVGLSTADDEQSVSAQVSSSPVATSVWFSVTPDSNWDGMTDGKWKVFITMTDNSNL